MISNVVKIKKRTVSGTRSGSTNTPLSRSLKVLALMLGSYAIGFTLVLFFFKQANNYPSTPSEANKVFIFERSDAGPIENSETQTEDEDIAKQGELPPEVPPGAVPDGVRIDGTPMYLRCWDSGGTKYDFPACDALEIFEKRMATRIYVVNKCKCKHAGVEDEGILSLGAQLDFKDHSISFWSGPSSEIENAKRIGTCIRRELRGMPIDGIEHKVQKYRIFFTIEFRDPKKVKKELRQKRRKGKTVDVVKDRVRVREAPVNGRIIGNISSDNKVTLLNRDKNWCKILTPNDNEGWMICHALDL